MPRTDHLNHKPDEQGIKNLETLRQKFIELDELIDSLAPASREKSLAYTNLEQSRMWAVKAIVMQYPAQEIGTGGELPENRG